MTFEQALADVESRGLLVHYLVFGDDNHWRCTLRKRGGDWVLRRAGGQTGYVLRGQGRTPTQAITNALKKDHSDVLG
ncbi:hypothetical protein HDIA_0760 [Hartmannibacter diazotrophicus]|uniref:Uncharacterized protein n=1 Tax=Hartmannibacter diazotrophicus TaxID=1482074 RepID=A0A2C9D3D5_9HYPH|nr:hypothetical protein [Hartmannibacter diazotrophicus]SON54301.1 hypothetical protein HDIA_0760 [Hartmannibacter diazotrophicus]